MVTTEKRITSAQLACIVFILGMSLKMLVLPVLLIKSVWRDAAVSIALILSIEFVCLIALTVAFIVAPDERFPVLVQKCFGKWVAKVLFVLFAVYFFFKLILLSGEVRIFFSENLFADFNWQAYSLPLFALCAVMGMGTARAIGRTAQFLLPCIVVAIVVLLALVGAGADLSGILPFLEHGAHNAMRDVVRFSMWYGDYSILVVFLGSVKRTKKTAVVTVAAGFAALLAVLFYSVILISAFSSVADYVRYGQNVMGMSPVMQANLMQGRFDLLFFCIWLFSVFVKAGVLSYAAVTFLCTALPVRQPLCSLIFAALLYFVTMLWGSATGLQSFMIETCAVASFVFQFVAPIVALVVAFAGRHRVKKQGVGKVRAKKDKKKDSVPQAIPNVGKEVGNDAK